MLIQHNLVRYSKDVVHSNFVWIEPTDNQRRAIEATAQKILDVREKYPDAPLADLCDELSMSKDLRDVHRKNELAVVRAYGWEKFWGDESVVVVQLLKLYEKFSTKSA